LIFWYYYITFALQSEAIHNKDYSVVKTFKAAQVAFFYYINVEFVMASKFKNKYINIQTISPKTKIIALKH